MNECFSLTFAIETELAMAILCICEYEMNLADCAAILSKRTCVHLLMDRRMNEYLLILLGQTTRVMEHERASKDGVYEQLLNEKETELAEIF